MAGFGDIGIRRVRTAQDWGVARALRFDGLASRGDISGESPRAFSDSFDEAANTTTYLLLSAAEAIGTTRTSVSVPPVREPLPSQRVFGREIVAAFGPSAALVEASLTFVVPEAAHDPQDALMRLFRVHLWRCAAENADALVVAVRESQMGFYRRRFNMEILSGPEAWPQMAAPRVLMGLAWRQHSAQLLRRMPELAMGSDPN